MIYLAQGTTRTQEDMASSIDVLHMESVKDSPESSPKRDGAHVVLAE